MVSPAWDSPGGGLDRIPGNYWQRQEEVSMATGRWSAVFVLVMALTGAACSSDGGSSGSSTPTSGGGGGAAVATVVQSNYQFTPSKPTVSSGDTLAIENSTPSTPHTFTVDGQSIDVEITPGSSQDVTIDLPAGTYPFHCRFHQSQGMTGTLTVT
jgi:plastocyanin